MLILITDSGIVIRGRIPQATARDLDTLILHLTNGNLHNNLVTWNIHRGLAFLLDFVGNVFTQRLELITKITPLFDPLIIYLPFEFTLEDFICNNLCLGWVETLILVRFEMIRW